jgi:hypothetical protein
MKRVVNKEELRVYWQLGAWYEKWIYVLGMVYTILLILAFIVGFIAGVLE